MAVQDSPGVEQSRSRRVSLEMLGGLILAGVARQLLTPKLGAASATAIGAGVFGALATFALARPRYRTVVAVIGALVVGALVWAVAARL